MHREKIKGCFKREEKASREGARVYVCVCVSLYLLCSLFYGLFVRVTVKSVELMKERE